MTTVKPVLSDKRIVRIATDFRRGMIGDKPGDLCCAMICWPLAPLLRMSGLEVAAIESWFDDQPDVLFDAHIWLLMPDGRALDPTADQLVRMGFPHLDLPPVYLGPRTEAHVYA